MGLQDQADVVKTERLTALVLFALVILFTVWDIFEDFHEGSSAIHALGEICVIGSCLLASIYLWRRINHSWSSNTAKVREQLRNVWKDANKWKDAHATLSKGLSSAIEQQLDQWGLTGAEKEIAFLLMKGLSFKEIADIRATSEHTVRQQAGTIYRKSGLEGRSQLAAFFLEDLLTFTRRE